MIFVEWLKKQLGFVKITPYEKRYINDANIHTAVYMSFIVVALELWMLLRYIQQRPGFSAMEYFDGETNYLILCSAGILLFIFAVRYIREMEECLIGKIVSLAVVLLDIVMISRFLYANHGTMNPLELLFGIKYHLLLMAMAAVYVEFEFAAAFETSRADLFGQTMCVIFGFINIGFGIETSMYDLSWGRQILCFATMVAFCACMLVWRPFISILILSVSFFIFYRNWKPILQELDLVSGKVLKADTINFFVFWIVLVMISFSIYHQRLTEAQKDENLVQTSNRLNRMAAEDELTGIHNMNYFNQEATYSLRDKATDVDNMIFLFFNIENFKTYNDQIGYQAGNAYLKKVAELIRDTFVGDPTARWSDDHFVVLTDADTAEEKTEIIRKAIHEETESVYLELKVGGYRPLASDLDPRIAIDYARYACSLTKNKFNMNFKEYDKAVDDLFHKRQYIVNNIDTAVANGYIQVFYQPVVWADNRELCGTEALARWIDPTYGFLSPADFVPVLEDNRLIHKLDGFMLRQVCRDLRADLDAGHPIVPVSINFSRLDFELLDVVKELEENTQKYEIPRDYIHVEITESALTDDDGFIYDIMKKLHECGYSVWLDDFGSGYSSLNVLKDYHFDMMKIDMKFLANFGTNEDAPIILNTVIKLAADLKMMSLTEGVETEEIADFLTKAGCERLQGYYFGKPMPIKEIKERIESGEYKLSERLA
ncbi:MAG: EAL domain-containing protein [Lachnospiraceae bacterium]|nr:EAL domain-containing protein [Lachnospiraceae bacterium]